MLEKLRPFASQHSQALLSQKAHYLRLLEEERKQNLQLRLEQSLWQEGAAKIKDNIVFAMKLQSTAELPYVRKIARLKADNKSLRRMCGVPLLEDTDDESSDDEVQKEEQGKISAKQSPNQKGKEMLELEKGGKEKLEIR